MQSSEVGGNRRVIAWTLGLCLLVLLAVPAFAQESGSVLGVVKDASGGVVPNAKLTITNTATAESRSATTGADGAYRFAGLRPGTYTLKIEAQGFQTQTLTDLILNVAADLVTNATLQVGAATQEVTVTGEAPVINTTTSSLGNLVNDQTISELPLNGRNYTDLTLLAPGVVQTTHSGLGDSGTWFSSNGAPPRSNNYMLDGAITVTKNGTGPASTTGSTLGVDGIKEYKLVTNSFSAEYGLLMGSQMIMVSKGGTNKWSGSLFEYLRNNHLDARNFFDPQPDKANNILTNANGDLMRNPQFKRNNFGGSFGGPIQKDKTFFFFVYEGLRLQQGDTIQTTSMPLACHVVNNGEDTILVGGGDISAADLAKLQTRYPNISHQILQGPLSGTTTLADVSGLGLATNNCLGQAAGHVVDPLVQPWIGQFPFPNENLTGTSSNYTFNGQSHARDDYAQLRIDHNFSANDTFFSRYTIDDGLITTPYLGGNLSAADTGPAYPQYTNVGRSRNQYITLGENHIFSPVLLNSFRLSFSRMIYNNNFTQQNTPMNPDFFLQDNDPTKCYYIVPGDSAHQTPSCIWSFVPGKFTGGFNPGSGVTALTPPGTFPNYHYNNVWTLDDDLFFTHGKHAFKFGTLITRMNQPHLQSKSVFGAITFGNINNFLNGIAQNYNQVVPGTTVSDPSCVDYLPCPTLNSDFGNSNFLDRDHTWYTVGLYIQDDYRATARLTLNLGLRYEFMTNISEMYNKQSTVPDIRTSSSAVLVPNGIWQNASLRNFSPRLGFAWDVLGTGKTAVRGGFGIYYDVANIGALLTQNSTGVPPFLANTTFAQSTHISLPLQPELQGATPGRSLQMGDYQDRSPHSLQYNLSVEQQIPLGIGVAVSYVGRRGLNLYTGVEGNPVVPESFVDGVPHYNVAAGQAGCLNNVIPVNDAGVPQPFFVDGHIVDPSVSPLVDPSVLKYPCRMNPFWTSALFYTNASSSWYNSLQLAVTKRLSRGLMFQAAYTYSRATDTTQGTRFNDDCGGPAAAAFGRDPYNVAGDYGPSCFDITHSMHFNMLYHFPTLSSNGFLSKIANGWWMGNIVSVNTGPPTTPIVQNDRSFSGIVSQQSRMYASLNTSSTVNTTSLNFIPYDASTLITGDPNQWFNPLMFGVSALGLPGDSPRGILRDPGLGNWDFSLVKDTKLGFLGEGGNLQFRAEFFNILNRANFAFLNTGAVVFNANTTTNCPSGATTCNLFSPFSTAGQITQTATTSRQIQFALRLSF